MSLDKQLGEARYRLSVARCRIQDQNKETPNYRLEDAERLVAGVAYMLDNLQTCLEAKPKDYPIGINLTVPEATALMLLGKRLDCLDEDAQDDLGRDGLNEAGHALSRIADRLYSNEKHGTTWTVERNVS